MSQKLNINVPRPPGGESCGRLYIVREGLGVRIWKGDDGLPESRQFRSEEAREAFIASAKEEA